MYNRGIIMTDDERLEILKWIKTPGRNFRTLYGNRFDYKLHRSDELVLPLIFKIQDRIEQIENMIGYKHEPLEGDFIAVILPGGSIPVHIDVNDLHNDLYHVRFNVFLEIPKNTNTYYQGNIIDAKESGYVLCRSGIDKHYTDISTTECRISLSFGYLLPPSKIDDLCSDRSIGVYQTRYPLVNYIDTTKRYIEMTTKKPFDFLNPSHTRLFLDNLNN
jgi:hypothetical protein